MSDPATTSVLVRLSALIERLRTAAEPVVVIADDLIVGPAAIAPLTSDPFASTSVLVVEDCDGDLCVLHHQVVSAGTAHHVVGTPTHRSVGVVRIAVVDAPAAAEALVLTREHVTRGDITVPSEQFVELVIVALVRSGIPVRAVGLVDVPWFRIAGRNTSDERVNETELRALAESIPEERIRRLQANRIDDGFYSTFVVRKASKPLTRAALRLGLSPNTITLISFIVGLAAALSFAGGSFIWLLLGAALLQLSLVIDCVDGEVARATRRFSALGAWLDASTDRVKEFAAYGGLAVGAARDGADVWWLVLVLITMQTFRHMGDYDFSRVQRLREAAVPLRDLRDPTDGTAARTGISVAAAMDASRRMNRSAAVRWAKKVVHMPIGERWLLISVVAVLAGPRWALIALLAAGLVALAYVLTGRILRTLTWRDALDARGVELLRAQTDLGPLGSAVAAAFPARVREALLGAPFGWSMPALLRLLELGSVTAIVLIAFPGAVVVAYAWLFVVAYHHYDTLYRALNGARTPRWIVWWGLGWEGRLVVVVALAALASTFASTLLVMTAALLVLFVPVASVQWLRSNRTVGGEI